MERRASFQRLSGDSRLLSPPSLLPLMSLVNAFTVVAASIGGWAIYRICQVGRRESDLPPGPPTIPLLGNLHVFPKQRVHIHFSEWAKQYGEIYSLKLAQGTAVVITSAAAVREILETNSALTSDRPPSHIADITFDGNFFPFGRYDDHWRNMRRGAHEILTPQACKRHLPIQQAEATQLMHDLLTRPENFYNSVRRYSSSVLFSVLFGKRAPQFTTPEITAYFKIQHIWEEVVRPGAQPPVDMIPILKRVPERWAGWKTICRQVREMTRKSYFGLLDGVEKRVARGDSNGCFMETLCERGEEWGLDREMTGYIGGILFDTGADTTSGALQGLILALVAFPEVQKKAQMEIDAVIGMDRAPRLEDVDHLPYVQAVIKEVHRFRPVAPLGLPHAAFKDVMYKGYRIPAGSIIFPNLWGILHDENSFEDESRFNPDRYMGSPFGLREEAADDPKDWKDDLTFGNGRRVCPGIHLAKNSIAINTVNLLWAFNFGRYKDPETGAEVEPDIWDWADGIAMFPNPFKCTITPRSPNHAELIEREFAEATTAFLPFEQELVEEDRKFVEEQRKSH